MVQKAKRTRCVFCFFWARACIYVCVWAWRTSFLSAIVCEQKIFDSDLKTHIGGDKNSQHDELTVVKLAGVCKKGATFKVYGRDSSVSNTNLRHIRTGYSLDGKSWKCYTKGSCCGMTSPSTQCNWGSQHGNNGMSFTVPGPLQYFMVGTWGRTEIWEIQFVSCS